MMQQSNELNNILKCFKLNKLSLKIDKSKLMIFPMQIN